MTGGRHGEAHQRRAPLAGAVELAVLQRALRVGDEEALAVEHVAAAAAQPPGDAAGCRAGERRARVAAGVERGGLDAARLEVAQPLAQTRLLGGARLEMSGVLLAGADRHLAAHRGGEAVHVRWTADDEQVDVAGHAARLVAGTDIDIGPEALGDRVGDGVRVAVHGFVDDEGFHGLSIISSDGRSGDPPHRCHGIPRMSRRGAGHTVAACLPPQPLRRRAAVHLNHAHAWLYARTRGRLGGSMGGHPVLLLPRVGRRSGAARRTPVQYERIDGDLILVAAAGGAPEPPAWWRNLDGRARSDRAARRAGSSAMLAIPVGTDERRDLWPRCASATPSSSASSAAPAASSRSSGWSIRRPTRRRDPCSTRMASPRRARRVGGTMTTKPLHTPTSPLAGATVRTAMQLGLFHCPPDADLRTLARVMAERSIHCVVVGGVHRENGGERLTYGIVSDLDLMRGLQEPDGARIASDVATTELVPSCPARRSRRRPG